MLGNSISNYTASQNATHLILAIHKTLKWNRVMPLRLFLPLFAILRQAAAFVRSLCEAARGRTDDGGRRSPTSFEAAQLFFGNKALLLFACVILWSTFHCRRWLCRHFSSCCWRKRRFRFSVFFPERRVTIIKVVISSVVSSKKSGAAYFACQFER